MSPGQRIVRRLIWVVVAGLIISPLIVGVAWLRVAFDGQAPSAVIGTVANGRLENGHVIPPWGRGYMTYSFIGAAMGRQYVDGRVREALTAALAARSQVEAHRTFVVGETGRRVYSNRN